MIKFEIKWLLSKLYYLLIASKKNTYYRMSLVASINISQGSVATCYMYGGPCKFTTDSDG